MVHKHFCFEEFVEPGAGEHVEGEGEGLRREGSAHADMGLHILI